MPNSRVLRRVIKNSIPTICLGFHNLTFTKIKNAKKILSKKDKVKFTVKFKGRERQHINLGKDLMNRIIIDTKEVGKVETHPKFEGRQMIMIIQPN